MSENDKKKVMSWTSAQTNAIKARGNNVLVCAAAGSGKTATLTERIIRRLTDPEDPADVSRMVIVTYTRNAAAELREKIYDAISSKLKEDPDNSHLQIQLMKLPGANISTIHSFCLNILKRYRSTLDLPATIKIADEGETEMRAYRVMEQVIADFYDGENEDGTGSFTMLAESLTTAKQEGKLAEIFLSLYTKLCAFPGGASKLATVVEEYDEVKKNEFFDTKYGEVYRDYTNRRARSFYDRYRRIIDEVSTENPDHALLPYLRLESDMIRSIIASVDIGYDAVRSVVNECVIEKLGNKKIYATETYAKDLRNETDKWFAKIKKLYTFTPEQIGEAAEKTAELARTLYGVLSSYEESFRKEKREAGVLDYHDLEHYTNMLLWDGEEKSDAAREIEALYDEIYIDEFQDVNELQDSIFRAVSNGHNLFMVGDVKQSIYGFRGGDPSIIIDRRNEYEPYVEGAVSDTGMAIFMQNNFRCDSSVVNYSNDVFATLLGRGGGAFSYTREDELVYSKDGGVVSENETAPRFVVCAEPKDDKQPGFDAEAAFVAEEIVRLLESGTKNDGTPIKPGDIAILIKKNKGVEPIFKRELERRGVPVISETKKSPFDSPELQLVMCMLNVIDNPHRDIYLAGVLMSEIYNVTVDEMVAVRLEYPKTVSLYDAVCRYTEEHNWEKGERFITSNNAYRDLSRKVSVDRLIWQIYLDTGLLSVATDNYENAYTKKVAKNNCMIVYELARSFEAGSFKGLYNFIEHVNSLIEAGKIESGKMDTSEDAVKIITIHGSKGLEYPVCFVCRTGSIFSNMDTRSRMLFNPEVGIGFMLRGKDGFTVSNTPFRSAVELVMDARFREEEMRVLYVALTRARERLYVTATRSNLKSFGEKIEYLSDTFDDDMVNTFSCFAEGILVARSLRGDTDPYETVELGAGSPVHCFKGRKTEDDNEDKRPDNCEQVYSETLSELKARLSSEYPYRALTRIKAKMSVSKLYPSVLDEIDETAEEHERPQLDFSRVPKFSTDKKAATGAEKGSATHLIMQFADFARMERNGVADELDRLVTEGYIDENSAKIAKLEDIERVLAGGFYQRIKRADRLWREFRFNLRLDAASFTENEELREKLRGEKLLVQGVIDGFFMEGEDIVLFDYKTDYLTPQEIADPEKATRKLTERHAQQLCYYKMALERIFSRKVDQVYIYSLPLGSEVRVNIDDSTVRGAGSEWLGEEKE